MFTKRKPDPEKNTLSCANASRQISGQYWFQNVAKSKNKKKRLGKQDTSQFYSRILRRKMQDCSGGVRVMQFPGRCILSWQKTLKTGNIHKSFFCSLGRHYSTPSTWLYYNDTSHWKRWATVEQHTVTLIHLQRLLYWEGKAARLICWTGSCHVQ